MWGVKGEGHGGKDLFVHPGSGGCQVDPDYASSVGTAVTCNKACGCKPIQCACHCAGIDMAMARELGRSSDAQMINHHQRAPLHGGQAQEIGRASCRERVCQYV